MSEQPKKEDAEGQGCPEGQERNAEGKCVPKSAGGSSADSQDDPELRAILIDSIKEFGYKIASDNCDSLKALKQLYKFAKTNARKADAKDVTDDSKLVPGPNTPDFSAPAADQKTDAQDLENTTDLSAIKIDAKDPNWQELMAKKIDSLQEKYYNYSDAPGVIIHITETGVIESTQGGPKA